MTGNTNKERKRLERERIHAQKERRKRLEKAAPTLLAACKLAGDQIIEDMKVSIRGGGKIGLYFSLKEIEQIQSAIEQAGEVA